MCIPIVNDLLQLPVAHCVKEEEDGDKGGKRGGEGKGGRKGGEGDKM